MAKRKRVPFPEHESPRPAKQVRSSHSDDNVYLQIVSGSYERVLHGIITSIPRSLLDLTGDESGLKDLITFADSFLLNAHASAIKCLALSPPPQQSSPAQKVILATGSTDEKINLYHLSTSVPRGPVLPLLGSATQENASNRSLGILHTHNAAITALHFPNRAKLLSSCGNNIIAVTATRTFNTMSLMKAPTPKHPNRPTGDTSTASTLPNGINDFAVHPSMKLMISVGRAERSMRLWNLVTGKKAGVLSFDKDTLAAIGESSGRWGSGEGHRVVWSPDGEEFVVCFDKGMCIFGIDCKPIAVVVPVPSTKLHQVRYFPHDEHRLLAVSTEDGRVLFYSSASVEATAELSNGYKKSAHSVTLSRCTLLAQLGKVSGAIGRIKDFYMTSVSSETAANLLLLVTAGSDGWIRVWRVDMARLLAQLPAKHTSLMLDNKNGDRQNLDIVHLLGSYETNNRITCLVAFQLQGQAEGAQHTSVEADSPGTDDLDELGDEIDASSNDLGAESEADASQSSGDD